MQGPIRHNRRFGRGAALFVAGALLLLFAWATRASIAEHVGGSVLCRKNADGTWDVVQFSDALAADIASQHIRTIGFEYDIDIRRGLGWTTWTARSSTRFSTERWSISPQEVDAAARVAWTACLDAPGTAGAGNEFSPGFEMLRDGVATRTQGSPLYLGTIALWEGGLLLVVAVGILAWRQVLIWRAELHARRIDRGVCARCEYPILRGEKGMCRCSECGADVEADYAAARRLLPRLSPPPRPSVTL